MHAPCHVSMSNRNAFSLFLKVMWRANPNDGTINRETAVSVICPLAWDECLQIADDNSQNIKHKTFPENWRQFGRMPFSSPLMSHIAWDLLGTPLNPIGFPWFPSHGHKNIKYRMGFDGGNHAGNHENPRDVLTTSQVYSEKPMNSHEEFL